MKKVLIALFGAALILGACGGADEPVPEETPDNTQEETQAPDETAGDITIDAARAEASFQSCAGCHGSDLQGQGGNPAIAGLPYEHVLNAIQQGPGAMPENMVTGEDAKNLAAWIAAYE